MEQLIDQRPPDSQQVASDASPHRSDTTLRLLVLLSCLALLLAGPFLAGRFRYATTYNRLRAEVDVATEALPELSSRLNDFVLASRLVAKRVGPSVVSIYRPSRVGPTGQGSGVIVDPAGYIVTNYHVIRSLPGDRSRSLRVRLSDGREEEATLVGDDIATDLAVLKIDLPDLIAAEWGDSDELEVGDLVWALGSPFGLDQSITFGIVSAEKRRRGRGLETGVYSEYLQTDAAVNPGNSGGPLVNVEGKIVGINSAIVGDAYQGVSFAIPSSLAREKYEALRRDGRIERGFIGIEPRHVPADVRERLHLARDEGVYVAHVNPPPQPAYVAGMRPGDVLLRWNEHVAHDPTELSRTIAATEIGSSAQVVVAREARGRSSSDKDVERVELTIVVGRRSDFAL